MMDRKVLINDLKELILSKPDKIGVFGIKYHMFSIDEIKGIIELLETYDSISDSLGVTLTSGEMIELNGFKGVGVSHMDVINSKADTGK